MKFNAWKVITLTFVFGSLRLFAQGSASANQVTIVEFDAPGAATSPGSLGTQAFANNASGSIVGYYVDANVVPHGFLRSTDGSFTTFDAPGAGLGAGLDQGTVPIGINDLGEIAGQFEDSNNVFHGFVRFPDGHFDTFEAPGAGTGANQGTMAYSINFEGDTAGISIDSSNQVHGFVRTSDGTITIFDVPGDVGGTFVCEETCLNGEGTVTGWYTDVNGTHGFERTRDGEILTFDSPEAGTAPNLYTIGASIKLAGTIAGYSIDSNNVAHGYMRTSDGKLTTFDDPVAATGPGQGTAPFSISLLGQIAGEFSDSANAMHGFVRWSGGSFTTIDMPHAGTSAYQGTRPSTNNAEGAVTGWFVDGNNVSHGFLWRLN